MDIHRSRFIPYPSSAINALAFSAINDIELGKGGEKNLRLAVGRANGDIEIWNPSKGTWVQETVFHGGRDRTVEGLLWIQEPNEYDERGRVTEIGQLRLFSIGYSSTVTEWNLATGTPLRQSTGNHSEVWCFAAQPRLSNVDSFKAAQSGAHRGQNIVVGCADGSIVLLSTADNDLHFKKFITRAQSSKSRAVSIDFRDRDTVVAGFSNSCFRLYDIRNSETLGNVTLGAGPKGARDMHVWSVRCLPNGDIITGDSSGEIRLFDGKLFAQYQRIKAHNADILDVAVSRDGSTIFSAGMDRKTSIFTKVPGSQQRFAKAKHMYYHDHDVKALATFDGRELSFLASGGLDTKLEVVPIRKFGEEYHRGLPGLPQVPPTTSSASVRLVASWFEQEVSIWKIKHSVSPESNEKIHRLTARIALKGDENVGSASLSKDGCTLAACTTSETRLFWLQPDLNNEGIKVQKLDIKPPLPGGRSVQISPDCRWLSIITATNHVALYRIVLSPIETEAPRIITQSFTLERVNRRAEEQSSALSAYRRAIARQRFSPDSRVLVVTDLSGFVDCWKLVGDEDRAQPDVEMNDVADDASDVSISDDEREKDELKIYGQSWILMESCKTLPILDSAALLLSFRPRRKAVTHQTNGDIKALTNGSSHEEQCVTQSSVSDNDYELFVLTANHRLYEFELLSGKITDWSKRNTTDCLPSVFQQLKDRAMGNFWHTNIESQRFYVYGSNWVFMFDVSQDFEPEVDSTMRQKENSLIEQSKKRKWEGENGAGDKMREEDATGFRSSIQRTQGGKAVRKRNQQQKALTNGGDVEHEEDDLQPSRRLQLRQMSEPELNQENGIVKQEDTPRKSWHSLAYRPILAIVPLEETDTHIETLIVERPQWELDLPDRLVGPHDRSI